MKHSTFNGCSRSEIKATPKNWNTQRASTKKAWRITYRFYDPAFKDTKLWGHQVPIKGMNEFKTLEERQAITEKLINQEKDLVDVKGYNPITRQYMAPIEPDQVYEIHPETLFIPALWEGLKKVDAVRNTLTDIRSVINGVAKACDQLFDGKLQRRYSELAIAEVSTRHIKYILEQCGRNNPRWSNNRFNYYKAYLSMIFKELKEVEAVEFNPTRDVSTKKKTRKLKAILSPEEQKAIDVHLRNVNYNFWRYMHIFFRSGSRTTELLRLKKDSQVNLEKQEFIVLVKKGKEYKESIRPIADDKLKLWQEVWSSAKPGQYLFGRLLQPGDNQIRNDQITRRWHKYVKASKEKGGLGINRDFNSLKHLHTDAVAEQLGMQYAQTADGHTSERTTAIYAVNEQQRQLNRLKKIDVKFAG